MPIIMYAIASECILTTCYCTCSTVPSSKESRGLASAHCSKQSCWSLLEACSSATVTSFILHTHTRRVVNEEVNVHMFISHAHTDKYRL